MTTTLCVETSGAYCSLALAAGDRVDHVSRLLGRAHNEHLLSMLEELFTTAGCDPADLELIAFSSGPGSFTGVRLGAAVVQAVATGAGALRGQVEPRVVGVSSSWIVAQTAVTQGVTATQLVTSIRSRGNAYYLALYRSGVPVVLEQVDELTDSAPPWCATVDAESVAVVGTGPDWLTTLGEAVAIQPDARVMVDMAREQHALGRSGSAETALPRYLAGDSPWAKVTTRA